MTLEPIEYREDDYGAVTVLTAANAGAFPYGNSVLVHGSEGTLLIDPALTLGEPLPGVDTIFISHAHEDHLTGLRWFDAPVHAHEDDIAAVRSREVLIDNYGLPAEARPDVAHSIEHEFGVEDRPDAVAVGDGHRFELGDRTATVVHLPGHTAGHCGVLVEPDGFFFIADIDLSSFGPLYADLGSSLADFEESISRCAEIDARWYGTFHHKGVIDGSEDFRARLARYRDVIDSRDQRLMELLVEPGTIERVAEERLVYRRHIDAPYVDAIERRTADLHVQRLLDTGAVIEVEPGLFRAVRG